MNVFLPADLPNHPFFPNEPEEVLGEFVLHCKLEDDVKTIVDQLNEFDNILYPHFYLPFTTTEKRKLKCT